MKYSDWHFFQNARSNEYDKHDLMNVITDLANRVEFLEKERVLLCARLSALTDNITQHKKGKEK